jgi:hypothetical protein
MSMKAKVRGRRCGTDCPGRISSTPAIDNVSRALPRSQLTIIAVHHTGISQNAEM